MTWRDSLNLSVTPTTLYSLSTVIMASLSISLCVIPGLEQSQKYRSCSSWLRPPCPTSRMIYHIHNVQLTVLQYQALCIIILDTFTEWFCEPRLFWGRLGGLHIILYSVYFLWFTSLPLHLDGFLTSEKEFIRILVNIILMSPHKIEMWQDSLHWIPDHVDQIHFFSLK